MRKPRPIFSLRFCLINYSLECYQYKPKRGPQSSCSTSGSKVHMCMYTVISKHEADHVKRWAKWNEVREQKWKTREDTGWKDVGKAQVGWAEVQGWWKSKRIVDSIVEYQPMNQVYSEQSPGSECQEGYPAACCSRMMASASRVVSSKASCEYVWVCCARGSLFYCSQMPVQARGVTSVLHTWPMFSNQRLSRASQYLDSNFILVPWELKNWCNSFKYPHLWPFWIMDEEICQKNENSCPPWIHTLCVQLSNLITHHTKTCFSSKTGYHFHLDPHLLLSACTW